MAIINRLRDLYVKMFVLLDSNLSQQTSLVNALMNRSDKDRDGMHLYNQLLLFYSSHHHYRNGTIFHQLLLFRIYALLKASMTSSSIDVSSCSINSRTAI